jgi:hypothetical protein
MSVTNIGRLAAEFNQQRTDNGRAYRSTRSGIMNIVSRQDTGNNRKERIMSTTALVENPAFTLRQALEATQYQITVENKMMRDARPVSAVQEPSSLCVVQLKGSGQDIYGADGVGEGTLRRYYEKSGPDDGLSGWLRQDISLPGHGFISMTSGCQADGTPRLFVMTADADVTPQQAGPATIYEIPLAADGTPGMPRAIASTSVFGAGSSPTMAFSPLGPSLYWGEVTTDGYWAVLRLAYGQALDKTTFAHEGVQTPSNPKDIGLAVIDDGTGQAVWPNVLVAYMTYGGIFTFYGTALDYGLAGNIEWPPPPPADASLASVVAGTFADGRRGLFVASQDSNNIYMLEGHPEPAKPGDVVWDESWITLPVELPHDRFSLALEVVETKEGGLALFCLADTNFSPRVFTARCGPNVGDPWGQFDVVLDFVGHAYAVFRDDEGAFGYAVSDPQGFIHLALRDDNEDWNVEKLDVDPKDNNQVPRIQQVNVYRVGVMISDDAGGPAIGKSVSIAPDDEVVVFVNGKAFYASADKPLIAQTDSTGSLWLMMDIDDSLAVPTFSLTSSDGIFGGNTIVVKPEADAQHYTTHVTADEIEKAVDDTGTPLLPAGSPYADIATNLNKLGESIAHIYAPREFVSDRLKVHARRGVCVVSGARELLDDAPRSAGHWAMTVKNGKAEFEELTPQIATVRRLELRSQVAVAQGLAPDMMPDNIFDDIEDAFESIGDAIIDAATVIIDGVRATVSYVIEGISHLIEVALDKLSVVLDVVKAVLDFAGAVFGRVLGWLIRAIGWLLGLPDIQKIKNDIKARIVANVASLHTTLPDPLTFVGPVKQRIEEWERDLATLIAAYKTTPQGTESNSQFFGAMQSVSSVFSAVGGSSVASEATWLLEKLANAVPDVVSLPDIPDMGITSAYSDIATQFSTASTDLGAFGSDMIAAGLESWLDSFTSLNGANLDPVLDAINKHGQTLLGCTDNVVGDAGAILHAMWVNPSVITDWLDKPIYIPFFSSFYEGLIGNEFSILDVVALSAAMPYSIIGPLEGASEKTSEKENDDRQALVYTIVSLMMVRMILNGLAAMVQQPAGEPAEDKNLQKIVKFLLVGVNLSIGSLTLAFAASDPNKKDHWYAPAVADLCVSVLGLFLLFAKQLTRDPAVLRQWGAWGEDGLALFATLLGLILNGLKNPNAEVFGYAAMKALNAASHLAVDQKWIDVTNPNTRTAYVGAQTAFGGLQAFLFQHDNA